MQVLIPNQKKKAQAETVERLAVSVREAAALLSVSERSVYQRAAAFTTPVENTVIPFAEAGQNIKKPRQKGAIA